MYWYYKYPFIFILLLITFGIGYVVYKNLPEKYKNAITYKKDKQNKTKTKKDADKKNSANIELVYVSNDDNNQNITDQSPLSPQTPSNHHIETIKVPANIAKRIAQAEKKYAAGSLVLARLILQKTINNPQIKKFDSTWLKIAKMISKINTEIINSDIPAPEKIDYVVVANDSLEKIARHHKTTVRSLQNINGLDKTSSLIHIGDVLYMIQANWSIEVYTKHYLLILKQNNKLFKIYNICIGKQNRTPAGTFVISNKILHPPWKTIPYGDPRNVLGTHWMAIKATGTTSRNLRGYGIHGTWKPETIGTADSMGCIRMYNKDVEELFSLVLNGTSVIINKED